MENQLPNKKPCGSNRILNSNLAMPTTSFGYGNQESCRYHRYNNQYSDFLENMKPYEDLLKRLNKPDATEDDIKDLCEKKKQYLPGYRFKPTDDKLVTQYLTKKIANQPIPSCFIRNVNVYQQHPKDLTGSYPNNSLVNKGWYFFSTRSRKYRNGTRPDRAAGNGFWKKTGLDQPVKVNDETVGFKETLVYYEGKQAGKKASKAVKTNWIMHEFKDVEKRDKRSNGTDMKLDDCVLCRIYHNGVVNVEEDEEEKEEEEVVEEDVAENDKEGLSSKVVDANPDEVCNAPSYDADDIILTELDTKNTMHLLEEKEEEGPSLKIAQANQDDVYNAPSYDADDIILTELNTKNTMNLLEGKEEECLSSKSVEANQDEVYDLLLSDFLAEEENPSSKSTEANQDEVYDLFLSDFLAEEENPSSKSTEANQDEVYDLFLSDFLAEEENPSSKSTEGNQDEVYELPFSDFSNLVWLTGPGSS